MIYGTMSTASNYRHQPCIQLPIIHALFKLHCPKNNYVMGVAIFGHSKSHLNTRHHVSYTATIAIVIMLRELRLIENA